MDSLSLALPGKPFTQDRIVESRAGGNWGLVVCPLFKYLSTWTIPVLTERKPRHRGILVACPASSGLQAAVLLVHEVAVCLHPSATGGPASWAERGGQNPPPAGLFLPYSLRCPAPPGVLSTRLLLVPELEPEPTSTGSDSQPGRGCLSWLVP